MSSPARPLTRLELAALLVLSGGLALWYAKPQLFYALHSVYESIRLLLPGALPPLGGAA